MEVPVRWYRGLRVTFILVGVALLISLAATLGAYVVQDARSSRNEREQRIAAESTNRLVCVTRPYVLSTLARARATARINPNPVTRATARQAIRANKIFLRGLVTIPTDFNCKPLIAQLKREALHT